MCCCPNQQTVEIQCICALEEAKNPQCEVQSEVWKNKVELFL